MTQHPAAQQNTKVPPPVIGSDRVILYAIVDKNVSFTGKQRLYVGDSLLGKVPRIAICKSLRKDLKDYLILFCNKKWQVLGVTGAKSLSLAKKEVEKHYVGVSQNWETVNTSQRAAKQWLAQNYPLDICCFCGKFSYDVSAMFSAPSAAICSSCVDAFADELKRRAR